MASTSAGTSWSARLGRTLFGLDDGPEQVVQGNPTDEKDTLSDSATANDALADRSAPAAQPIQIVQPRIQPATDAASHLNKGAEEAAVLTGRSPSQKAKNLHTILNNASIDDRGTRAMPTATIPTSAPGTQDRIVMRPTALSKDERMIRSPTPSLDPSSLTPSMRSASPSSVRNEASTSSPGLGTSLSQGVRTLSERYLSNREASDTFKAMREREGEQRPISPSPSSQSASSTRHGRAPSASSTGHVRRISSTSVSSTASRTDQDAPSSQTLSSTPIEVPEPMRKGEMMLKVTSRKVMQRTVRFDVDAGQILWDSKKNNRVNLESIREIRTGAAARSYRTSLSIAKAHEDRWLSIVYQTGSIYKALHLIALSDATLSRWHDTLQALIDERRQLTTGTDMSERRQSLWLRQQIKGIDTGKDARLDFDEIVRLCRRLGIMSNAADLRQRFNEADKEQLGYLDFANFQRFVSLLKRRVDVEAIFDNWADPTVDTDSTCQTTTETPNVSPGSRQHMRISRQAFESFLRQEQGLTDLAEAAVSQVFQKFSAAPGASKEGMTCDGFLAFLMSSDNSILTDQSTLASHRIAAAASIDEDDTTPADRSQAETTEALIAIGGQMRLTHDMTQPLSDYFISSSHNTYLVAGQLTGTSTIEGYIRALRQGARSVELDCWDGPGEEPVVTHGHTLTSKVPLRQVIEAIGQYAFVASPYPLILSLEIHNDIEQQDVVASILRTVLGDKLLSESLPDHHADTLPSPQRLMGKILVKAKNILLSKRADDSDTFDVVLADRSSTTTTTDTTESESDGLLNNARDLVRAVTKGRRMSRRGRPEDRPQGERKALMSPALASLLIYTVGVKHRGINKKELYAVEHMISLSERTALKYAKSSVGGPNGDDLIKHNRTHLTRIYPSMNTFARLKSSANFLPNLFWRLGCQLVALNWQTLDMGNEMNQAMFMRNGRSGYVLKPMALRKKEASGAKSGGAFDAASTNAATRMVQLSITVISGQQLPRDRSGTATNSGTEEAGQGVASVLNPFVSMAVLVPDTPAFHVQIRSDAAPTTSGRGGLRPEGQTSGIQPEFTAGMTLTPASSAPISIKNRRALARGRTTTAWQNGFNPIWDETITFQLQVPASRVKEGESGGMATTASPSTAEVVTALRGLLDLCFVRFEVRHDVQRKQSDRSRSQDARPIHPPPAVSTSMPTPVSPSLTSDTPMVRSPSLIERDPPFNNPSTTAQSTKDVAATPSSSSVSASLPRPMTEAEVEDTPCLASFMLSLGAMQQGYHHVPLYDPSMNQHLSSTLFVNTSLRWA